MAGTAEHPDPDTLDTEAADEAAEGGGDDAVTGVSAWGISIVLHAIILVILVFVVYAGLDKPKDAPIQISNIPIPPEEKKEIKRDIIESKVDIVSEVIKEDAVVHELDVPVEKLETEDEVVSEQPVKGREEADAVSEMGGTGAFMAIGAGGGASGAYGFRNGGGRKRAVGAYGGSQASESAVEAALRWFVRHQSPNGQWDVDGYPQNCQEAGPKCEPGTHSTSVSGDVACTGYALLCFLGAGYDHRSPNRYQATVKKGIDWLVSVQGANGLLGVRNYEHPVATMALAEAYAMTNDPALRDPVQRGVNVIMERQVKGTVTTKVTGQQVGEYGLGWDYTSPKMDRQDSSVSGWNVMALKAAKAGGIDIGSGLDGAKQWVKGAWEAANKAQNIDVKSLDPYGESVFPYTWNGSSNSVQRPGPLTCVGLLASVFLDVRIGDVMLDTMANYCYNKQTPAGWPTDTYYMYYNTLGMFQVQGEKWQKWNSQVRDMLVNAQRRDPACFDGSWDPQGAGGHHVSEVGRLLVTAYCCLSLEVYYRYLPMQGQGAAAPK